MLNLSFEKIVQAICAHIFIAIFLPVLEQCVMTAAVKQTFSIEQLLLSTLVVYVLLLLKVHTVKSGMKKKIV